MPTTRGPLLTVSAITALVKNALADGLPGTVHVVGQLSNFKRHGSGHLYFTLKDDASELGCIMWRSSAAKLAFDPQDGMELLAGGYIDVFERAGRYQLYCRTLEPRGVGALELAFRQMRQKLAAQGLFDDRHKKPLPPYPQRIAVVTSPTGAAVRDILQTLERRFRCAQVLLYPVAVQGPAAAGQIAAAIADLNRRRALLGNVDVMIVGRGGGSLEDLWAFNEEPVARAIFASDIPVVSAVGHEVDVTIADLVADVRAATPTAAAELVVPDQAELLARLEQLGGSLQRCVRHRAALARLALSSVQRSRALAHPLEGVRRREQTLDEVIGRMTGVLANRLQMGRQRLRRHETLIQRIQPHAYLIRSERRLGALAARLHWGISRREGHSQRRLDRAAARLEAASPALRLHRLGDRVASIQNRIGLMVKQRCVAWRKRVEAEAARLSALSYRGTLRRGFSITRTLKGRRLVRSPADVASGIRIVTETADGEFTSRVIDQKQMELFE
ncbi:MAG: exodeoxyribonuclease VII large subunit [Phycisphaerae bacterium]